MANIDFNNIKTKPEVFPSKWFCDNLSKDDVEFITGSVNHSSHLTTKSRLASSYWKKKSLSILIQSYKDDWHFSDPLIICVWGSNQIESDPPLGFISFGFSWQETKTKSISDLDLHADLIWVRPDKRGLGGVVARHIVSHFLLYLEECKLCHPYVSLKGVNVTYSADLYSFGGEKISIIIMDHLETMKEWNKWKVREIEYNACM